MAIEVRCIRGVEIRGEAEPLVSAPVRVWSERHSAWGGGWAARILALDEREKGGLRRAFLRPHTRNLSRAGHGYVEFLLTEAGLYEIEYVLKSFQRARVFLLLFPTGEVRIVGYHDPNWRRPRELDEALAEALALIEGEGSEPEPEPDPEPIHEAESETEPEFEEMTGLVAWESIPTPDRPEALGRFLREAETLARAAAGEGLLHVLALAWAGEGEWALEENCLLERTEWAEVRARILEDARTQGAEILAEGEFVLALAAGPGVILTLALPARPVAEAEASAEAEEAWLGLAAVGGA